MRGPLAIVVGSEGQGLGPAVRSRCDVLVRIPLRGAIESLNAAVAGSILLFEADSQRHDSLPTHSAATATVEATERPKRRRSKSVEAQPVANADRSEPAPESGSNDLLPDGPAAEDEPPVAKDKPPVAEDKPAAADSEAQPTPRRRPKQA
jgi:hypothetical protein